MHLVELRRRPAEDVLAALDAFADKAKEGDMRSIAIAAVMANGDVSSVFVDGGDTFALLGSIEYLKDRVKGVIE